MEASNRIVINTLVQYARTIVNLALSLYSSRLVLSILGVDDYGIYSLVAGVVSMLSFLTNSLVGSTQRFLSVTQGKGNVDDLKKVFNNSLILHIILGVIAAIILGAITPLMFDGFLNIPTERLEIAKKLYILVVLMVSISFIAAPYRALLISHENIVYISLIDVLDGVLKVLLVLLLPHISLDKLLTYGLIMLFIQVFNLLAFMLYSHKKYEECIRPRLNIFSLGYVKELSSFTGWIIYSSVCITARNQGLAVILNKVFGPMINAAYGIGAQISGMLAFVGASFNNAIAPQLMAAEGGGDRQKMLRLAEAQSKFSFLLMAVIGVPAIFEMPKILNLWLVDVPESTVMFGRMFLSMQIVDMLSTGLGAANKAIGNIGYYTFVVFTPKLLILPLSWLFLKMGLPLIAIAILMFSVELLSMLLRIYLFRKEVWFCLRDFINTVIWKTMPPTVVSAVACLICQYCMAPGILRFVLTFSISIILFTIVAFYISLNKREQNKVWSIIKKYIGKWHGKKD